MTPVKVVLSNGEDDEIDLGVFNQGVVISTLHAPGSMLVDCVASSETICIWQTGFYRDGRGPYLQMFVQAVDEPKVPRLRADMENIEQRGEA